MSRNFASHVLARVCDALKVYRRCNPHGISRVFIQIDRCLIDDAAGMTRKRQPWGPTNAYNFARGWPINLSTTALPRRPVYVGQHSDGVPAVNPDEKVAFLLRFV